MNSIFLGQVVYSHCARADLAMSAWVTIGCSAFYVDSLSHNTGCLGLCLLRFDGVTKSTTRLYHSVCSDSLKGAFREIGASYEARTDRDGPADILR